MDEPHWEIAKEDFILRNARVLLDRENSLGHRSWIICRGFIYIQKGEAWLNLETIENLPTY